MLRLSTAQARKIILHSQGLPPAKPVGRALAATLSAVEQINYVQIDSLSVVQRAHHHTLWNRNPHYQLKHLAQLLQNKSLFEYWSHAAAYLPMRDFRFTLARKHAFKTREQDHWYTRDHKLMRHVLDRIRAEGPLMAKDFDAGSEQTGQWQSKPAKRALGNLFMQGDLMVPYRRNFHKVYDLTHRVLPPDFDTSMPSTDEYHRHLITRFVAANGLGREAQFTYLLKGLAGKLKPCLNDLCEVGQLQQCQVGENNYYLGTDALKLLDKPLNRRAAMVLSPFDNLLIQRKRMQDLFGFNYQIECYLPAAKRKFGYFCLPVLWGGELIAQMDCKVDRKTQVLHVLNLVSAIPAKKIDKFCHAMAKQLQAFMAFNQCTRMSIGTVSQAQMKSELIVQIKLNSPGDEISV